MNTKAKLIFYFVIWLLIITIVSTHGLSTNTLHDGDHLILIVISCFGAFNNLSVLDNE